MEVDEATRLCSDSIYNSSSPIPDEAMIVDESDADDDHQLNILDVIGKYERVQYCPPYDVSALLSIPFSENYRILCGNVNDDFRVLPFPQRDWVIESLHPASEEYLKTAYQQISTFREEAGTSWFPSWISKRSSEQMTFALFTTYWQQYLSSLSPGKGLDKKDTWIELPESVETKELFERLLSSIPSLNISDILQNESVIQSLLVLFNVYEMTENYESRAMKRHWSTIYLPSCLFSHILQCSSTSLTPFVAQQFATILIQSITYHLSINTFHNPLILNAITSSLILFLHACDHIKIACGVLLQVIFTNPLCHTLLSISFILYFILRCYRRTYPDNSNLQIFTNIQPVVIRWMKEVEKECCFTDPFFWTLWLEILHLGRFGSTADDWIVFMKCFESDKVMKVVSSTTTDDLRLEEWNDYLLSDSLPISLSLQQMLLDDRNLHAISIAERCFYSIHMALKECEGVVYKKTAMNLMFAISPLEDSYLTFIMILALIYENGRDTTRINLNKSLMKDLRKRYSEPTLSFLLFVYTASLSTHLAEDLLKNFISYFNDCLTSNLFLSLLPLLHNLFRYHRSSTSLSILLHSLLPPLSTRFIPSSSAFKCLSHLLSHLISIASSSPHRFHNLQDSFHQFILITLQYCTSSLPPSSTLNDSLILILSSSLFLQLVASQTIPQAPGLMDNSLQIMDILIPLSTHELVLLGERSVSVLTEFFSYISSFNSRGIVCLFLPTVQFFFLLFELILFQPSCQSLFTRYSQSITLPLNDEITTSLPSLPQPLTLTSLTQMLSQLSSSLQDQFRNLLRTRSLASVWAEGITQMRLTSLQRVEFLLDVVALIARNPGIFLDVRILREFVDALMPALLVQKSGLFQDIEALFFIPLIDRNPSFFDHSFRTILINSRKAYYYYLLQEDQIPVILYILSISSSSTRFDLHLLEFVASFSNPARFILLIHAYFFGEGGSGELRSQCEKDLGWMKGEDGLAEGETELLRDILCCVVLSVGITRIRIEKEMKKKAVEVFGLIEGLMDVSLLDENAIYQKTVEDRMCEVCECVLNDTPLSEQDKLQFDTLRNAFFQRHSLNIGNRGVIQFNGITCSLTLNDLPSSLYSLVNEFVSKRFTLSFSSFPSFV